MREAIKKSSEICQCILIDAELCSPTAGRNGTLRQNLGRLFAPKLEPLVTYSVIETKSERRGQNRRRTRLITGKLVDENNQFLVECIIFDRSKLGARLKLARNIEYTPDMRLYEDIEQRLTAVSMIWEADHELGIRFGGSVELTGKVRSKLAQLGGALYGFA